MRSGLFFSRSRGFGLLEVILVFAIVIGAAAVVFTVFQSAKPSADAANEASNITTLATNIKSTYGLRHDYTGLDNTQAIAAKLVPSSMTNGSDLYSQWGAVTVAGTSSQFTITYNGVPTDTCAKLVSGIAGYFPTAILVDGEPILTPQGKVNPAMLITNCAGASGANTVKLVMVGK